MTWDDVVTSVRAKVSPQAAETFARLHRNFTGYASETTLRRFYGFVFSQGLHLEVNGFRFHRLEKILQGLARRPALNGGRILEVGAGAGLVSVAARKILAPAEYVVDDLCAEARTYLEAQGFSLFSPTASETARCFDLILCADALGEINSDEDGWLRDPSHLELPDAPVMLEGHYGFARKLEAWKPMLAPGGTLLLWEPFSVRSVWNTLADLLRSEGWHAHLEESVPGGEYLELSRP
jgi:hypothetical protein